MLLQLGDIGDNVKYLQYGLHILCCSPNGFDGEFGEGTLTAVKKFQSKYGLVSDGIVGDYTWNTLKNEITTIQSQLNKKESSFIKSFLFYLHIIIFILTTTSMASMTIT